MSFIAISGLAILHFQVYLFVKTTNTTDDFKNQHDENICGNYGYVHMWEENMTNWERSLDGNLFNRVQLLLHLNKI